MKGYRVYSQIKQLKEKGFKRAMVAEELGINRRTVTKYWDMGVEEYEDKAIKSFRTKQMARHEKIIVTWLTEHPTMSASQVGDWLKEHYKASYSERTTSRYVKDLRERYHLKKAINPRSYEAVPELPMGQQVQVDFGEKWMKNVDGNRVKVFSAVFVLAHSRYKYAEHQARPFRATDLVQACHRCFRFFGGIPQELVFDQDSIVCVSENLGDIIHTYEFEKLRQDCKFNVYMCRGADPESKGKVENAVKYVKNNFLENRIYLDDETLNYSGLGWLERTANAKVHGTTKRIPAEVWREEREYLRPLLTSPTNDSTSISRTVRKDNTIIYASNRYSVPLDTFHSQKEVRIQISDDIIRITTEFGEPICEHVINTEKGQLIQKTNHTRDRSSSIDQIQEQIVDLFSGNANEFVETIRTEKSRYARDQFRLIQTLYDRYGKTVSLEAIQFCIDSKLFSANYMKDYLEHSCKALPLTPPAIPVMGNKYHVTTEKRSLADYGALGDVK